MKLSRVRWILSRNHEIEIAEVIEDILIINHIINGTLAYKTVYKKV